MSEAPHVSCPQCGAMAHKMPSVCGISIKNSKHTRRVFDNLRRENDIKHELKDRYNVESVCPLAGQTVREVYADICSRGSEVRDMMQAKAEHSAKVSKAKHREWAVKARRRAPQRQMEMQRRKEAEAAAKRRIVL